jgi:thiol-disulfide isomerase/thioredoxin
VLGVVLAVQAWLARDLARGAAPPLPAPDLAARGAPPDGQALERPALVYFWATWCPTCDLQGGAVSRIARDHPVVTVALQSGGAGEVRSHLAAAGLDFPVVLDPGGRMAAAWGVQGVPAAFVVLPGGEIRFAERGYRTGPGLRARLWWARLTGSRGGAETATLRQGLLAGPPLDG